MTNNKNRKLLLFTIQRSRLYAHLVQRCFSSCLWKYQQCKRIMYIKRIEVVQVTVVSWSVPAHLPSRKHVSLKFLRQNLVTCLEKVFNIKIIKAFLRWAHISLQVSFLHIRHRFHGVQRIVTYKYSKVRRELCFTGHRSLKITPTLNRSNPHNY